MPASAAGWESAGVSAAATIVPALAEAASAISTSPFSRAFASATDAGSTADAAAVLLVVEDSASLLPDLRADRLEYRELCRTDFSDVAVSDLDVAAAVAAAGAAGDGSAKLTKNPAVRIKAKRPLAVLIM